MSSRIEAIPDGTRLRARLKRLHGDDPAITGELSEERSTT